jgi:hypothetical protein
VFTTTAPRPAGQLIFSTNGLHCGGKRFNSIHDMFCDFVIVESSSFGFGKKIEMINITIIKQYSNLWQYCRVRCFFYLSIQTRVKIKIAFAIFLSKTFSV